MLRLRPIRELVLARNGTPVGFAIRNFVSGDVLGKKQMPPRPPPVDESEFTEVFLCGSGPGGQKIVSSFLQAKMRESL